MVTLGKWRLNLAFEQTLILGDRGGLGQRLVLRKGTVAVGWFRLSSHWLGVHFT